MHVPVAPAVADVVDADDAREAARDELSDPVYAAEQPSLLERVADWVGGKLAELMSATGDLAPGGVAGLLVLLAVLVALVVVVRLRAGKLARNRRSRRTVGDVTTRTAAEHRAAAEAAFTAGDHATAVAERFRALAATLTERRLLDARAQLTADEIAAGAAATVPASATQLSAAARAFDDVFYGGLPATPDGYAAVVAADDAVRDAPRPAVGAT